MKSVTFIHIFAKIPESIIILNKHYMKTTLLKHRINIDVRIKGRVPIYWLMRVPSENSPVRERFEW